MRWDVGKVYRDIRKSKGLSQEDVCGNEISRVSLSKFENCKSIPSFEHMLYLLDQIDMTVEEFVYICNLYHPSERQKILDKMQDIPALLGTNGIRDILEDCERYLKRSHDITIQNIFLRLRLVNHIRENGLTEKVEERQEFVDQILTYLEKHDTWYLSDLKFLTAVLFSLSFESLEYLTDKILLTLDKYDGFIEVIDKKFGIYANLSTVYLANGRIKQATEFADRMLDVAQKTKRYDFLGFAWVRLGICQSNQSLIEKGVDLLELCSDNLALQQIKMEIDRSFMQH